MDHLCILFIPNKHSEELVMTRKITPVKINGKIVVIEVDKEIDTSELFSSEPDSSGAGYTRGGGRPVNSDGAMGKLKEKVADLTEVIESVVTSVDAGINKVKPDEWSVEFSVGYALEGDLKIPFISGSGKSEGGIKVTATWKSDRTMLPAEVDS